MSHHKYKHAMLARLRELGLRLDGIEEALEAPHSRDWDEMAIEVEGEEVMERLGINSQAEINRIAAALKRYADGEYGFCVTCGAEIAPERLDLLPETPFCRTCAANKPG